MAVLFLCLRARQLRLCILHLATVCAAPRLCVPSDVENWHLDFKTDEPAQAPLTLSPGSGPARPEAKPAEPTPRDPPELLNQSACEKLVILVRPQERYRVLRLSLTLRMQLFNCDVVFSAQFVVCNSRSNTLSNSVILLVETSCSCHPSTLCRIMSRRLRLACWTISFVARFQDLQSLRISKAATA